MQQNDQQNSALPKELSQPAQRALTGAGYFRLEQLTTVKEREIKQLHGVGPKAIRQLHQALAAHGLAFADE